MKTRVLGALLAGAVLLGLTGCNQSIYKNATRNTLVVAKNASITDISVEDYSEGNYDLGDLTSYINSEVEGYNSEAGEGSIQLNSLETEISPVKLSMTYGSMEHYNAFNHTDFLLTDAADAKLSGSFVKAADGSKVEANALPLEGMVVLQLDDVHEIHVPGGVQYYNEHVSMTDGTFVSDGAGVAVVLYKP